jgi:2-polyprenyl-3-methyl-5-hydroxy-6-metoxy-1,4-benzoquinol methylase
MISTGLPKSDAVRLRVCPVCGGADIRHVFHNERREFQTVACSQCRLVFSWPRPTEQQLTELYSADYFKGNKGNLGYANYRDLAEANMKVMWREFQQYVPLPEIKPKRILDVGCATGAFLAGAKQLGWHCIGIDRVESALQVARDVYGIETILGDITNQNTLSGSIGIVTMWHVLEHLVDPLPALVQAYTMLAPGGYLFVEVPNWNSVGRVVRGRNWANLRPPEHINHFSPGSLSYLISKAGFTVTRVTTHYPSLANEASVEPFNLKCQCASIIAKLANRIGRGGNLRLLARKPNER